jgi:hypothetical protein
VGWVAVHPTLILLRESAEMRSIASSSLTVKGVDGMFERLSRFVGRRELRRLVKAVDTAVRYEVSQALRSVDLPKVFPKLTRRFWSRVELHISVITDRVFDSVASQEDLKEFREVEMDLARYTARLLRNTGYERAEDLVYSLSIMIEYDLWLVEKVVKLGLEELLEKLSERALTEILEASSYLRYLGFAWISATTATLGVIKKYKVENRDTLSQWCREYAEEVDSYIDTIDTLLDDEAYEVIKKLENLEG